MKKKIILTLFIFLLTATVIAQQHTDSLAYQLQRTKINAMLAQRAQKFGQYDKSLSMHTGIFGLQTKRDIRRSNGILMDIVKTDDDIYKQIKILLDFRAFEQTQVQTKSHEIQESQIGYMTTINKLRNQIDKLNADAIKQQQENDELRRNFIIAAIVAGLFLLLLLRRRKKTAIKPKPGTTTKK
jgi:hypothetical protein